MDKAQFLLLDSVEQEEYIMNHGIFLMDAVIGPCMYDLYSLGSFYVELSYNLHQVNATVEGFVFDEIESLSKFLSRIDISKLLELLNGK